VLLGVLGGLAGHGTTVQRYGAKRLLTQEQDQLSYFRSSHNRCLSTVRWLVPHQQWWIDLADHEDIWRQNYIIPRIWACDVAAPS